MVMVLVAVLLLALVKAVTLEYNECPFTSLCEIVFSLVVQVIGIGNHESWYPTFSQAQTFHIADSLTKKNDDVNMNIESTKCIQWLSCYTFKLSMPSHYHPTNPLHLRLRQLQLFRLPWPASGNSWHDLLEVQLYILRPKQSATLHHTHYFVATGSPHASPQTRKTYQTTIIM